MLDHVQTAAVVQVDHLLKRFPGTIAVRDVSFAIRRRSIHALVGENGAGTASKSICRKRQFSVYQLGYKFNKPTKHKLEIRMAKNQIGSYFISQ